MQGQGVVFDHAVASVHRSSNHAVFGFTDATGWEARKMIAEQVLAAKVIHPSENPPRQFIGAVASWRLVPRIKLRGRGFALPKWRNIRPVASRKLGA